MWPEVNYCDIYAQIHFDDCHVHANVPHTQAFPTMSSIYVGLQKVVLTYMI